MPKAIAAFSSLPEGMYVSDKDSGVQIMGAAVSHKNSNLGVN